jgi:hypothetical protein
MAKKSYTLESKEHAKNARIKCWSTVHNIEPRLADINEQSKCLVYNINMTDTYSSYLQ